MRKRGRKLLAMMLAMNMAVNVMGIQAYADEPVVATSSNAIENANGTTTNQTITTTTTTDPETGKVTVNVVIENELKDTNAEDGIVISGSSEREETTVTDKNGEKVKESWEEDGTEKKEWTDEDAGDGEQEEVTVPLVPGQPPTKATDIDEETTGDINSPEGQTTTTTTDRTVTATTSKSEVKIEDANTGLVGEQETALKGLDPVYDENDDLHINPTNGQPLDKVNGEHVGKQDVFDRNYLSSKKLDYVNVNGVSIWVDKGSKKIVDVVIPDGAELPEHDMLKDVRVGASVTHWYPKSNTFAKESFPDGIEYRGDVKVNDIDNWYDADGDLVVTVPEDADFRYVGTGEHSKFYNARVTVVYKKDADGNTLYDTEGNPIIEKITKSDGTSVTIDGVPATELPEDISLVPIFDNYNGGRPTTFMLMDKNGNKVYAYCCDMETGAVSNAWYSVSNLEDSDYYGSEESEEHIRSIVMNGYWGTSDIPDAKGNYKTGSLEKIKAGLRDAIAGGKMKNEKVQMPAKDANGNPIVDDNGDPVMEEKSMLELIEELTEGEALLATQSAIWAYANGHVNALNGKDGVVVIDPDGYKWNQNPSSDSKDGEALNDYGSARVDFLYKWLINLETEETSTVIINDKNFVKDMSLTVADKVADHENNEDDNKDNDVYNTDLNFKLAFIPGENDDLLVQITYKDLDGNPVNVIRRLAGENAEGQTYEDIKPEADGSYVLKGLKLSENEDFNFDLRLEGTQYLEQGVYVYAPVGGRDVSQTFVGIAEGERNVDVSIGVTVSFDVDENNHVVAERTWHDEGSWEPEPEDDNPGGNGGNDGDGGSTPSNPNPVTPQVAAETFEIEESEVPLSDGVSVLGAFEIEDDMIPLGVLPATGDNSLWLMIVSLFSGLSLAGASFVDKMKKRRR